MVADKQIEVTYDDVTPIIKRATTNNSENDTTLERRGSRRPDFRRGLRDLERKSVDEEVVKVLEETEKNTAPFREPKISLKLVIEWVQFVEGVK